MLACLLSTLLGHSHSYEDEGNKSPSVSIQICEVAQSWLTGGGGAGQERCPRWVPGRRPSRGGLPDSPCCIEKHAKGVAPSAYAFA